MNHQRPEMLFHHQKEASDEILLKQLSLLQESQHQNNISKMLYKQIHRNKFTNPCLKKDKLKEIFFSHESFTDSVHILIGSQRYLLK